MTRYAMVWTEENKITMIGDDIEAMDGHTLLELPADLESWRFSLDDDGDLVIAYEGEDTETALASLKADQEAAQAANQAAATEGRIDGD